MSPITARPLLRPAYDNAAVHSFPAWFAANRRELIAWWWQCDIALRTGGGVAAVDPDDFEQFARCQYERELHS